MNLNLRLAEIDGKCPCEKPSVCYGFEDDQCTECGKLQRPNYLIPENLHELVRIADEQFIYWRFAHDKGGYYVSVGLDNEQVRSESLSAALAEAIVEE